MSTVAGIVGVGVAILVTVVACGPSDPLGVWKVSTVAGIGRIGVAILVTVIAFGPSDPLGVSKVSTVAGIVPHKIPAFTHVILSSELLSINS